MSEAATSNRNNIHSFRILNGELSGVRKGSISYNDRFEVRQIYSSQVYRVEPTNNNEIAEIEVVGNVIDSSNHDDLQCWKVE